MGYGRTNINVVGNNFNDLGLLQSSNIYMTDLVYNYEHDRMGYETGSGGYGTKIFPFSIGNKYLIYLIYVESAWDGMNNGTHKDFYVNSMIFDFVDYDSSITKSVSSLKGFNNRSITFCDDSSGGSMLSTHKETISGIKIGAVYGNYGSQSIGLYINNKSNYTLEASDSITSSIIIITGKL